MLYFAGIEKDDGKLETRLDAVSASITKEDGIAVGRPLKIELLTVQLANLHMEEGGLFGPGKDKPPYQPVIVSRCQSAVKRPAGTWEHPELYQLHYDSLVHERNKLVKKAEMDKGKRSTLVHYIPVYEGQKVNLTVSIYELDERIPQKTKEAIDGLFDVASAVFLPYSGLIFGAKKVFDVFVKLHGATLKHDVFLDETERVEWAPKEEVVHHASTCRIVCVQEKTPARRPIEPGFDSSQWKLNALNQLVDKSGNGLEDRCYAVLYISNKALPAGTKFANSQKAATLLSEIERQQGNEQGHRVVWEQLLNTMQSYSVGKDIQRILKLKENLGALDAEDKAKLTGFLNLPSIKALGFYDALKEGVPLD